MAERAGNNRNKAGFKVPKTQEEAIAAAKAYVRQTSQASKGKEKFYRREAARVPTEREQTAKIDELLAPAQGGISSSVASSVSNILGMLPGGAGSDAGNMLMGLLGNTVENDAVYEKSMGLERAKLLLASNASADTRRGAAREAAVNASVDRRSRMADWLGAYSGFAGMVPRGGGSFLGSGGQTPEEENKDFIFDPEGVGVTTVKTGLDGLRSKPLSLYNRGSRRY
jgi:hypothetical protein